MTPTDQTPTLAAGTCSFCPKTATTHVSDESDVMACCASCEAAWQQDPGFRSGSPTLATQIEALAEPSRYSAMHRTEIAGLVRENLPAIVTALRQAEAAAPSELRASMAWQRAAGVEDAINWLLAHAESRPPKTLYHAAGLLARQMRDELAPQGTDKLSAAKPQAEAAPGVVVQCGSCDGTGADLYDGTEHDCQVCSGRGAIPLARQHGAREGMVLVPKEPTEAMTRAGWTAITNPNNVIKQSAWHAQQVYAAMIAAAPATDVEHSQ